MHMVYTVYNGYTLLKVICYGGCLFSLSPWSSNLVVHMDSAYPKVAFFYEVHSWQDELTFIQSLHTHLY